MYYRTYFLFTLDEVSCQGLYDRKFVVLYEDGNAGVTTSKSLWVHSRSVGECVQSPENEQQVQTACTMYGQWKKAHSTAAKTLQHIADIPCYYKVCDEQVNVGTHVYRGTIRALHSAPKGKCKGTALASGQHPYTCEACEVLQHGKSSQLLRKLLLASKLKHPSFRTKQGQPSWC